MKLQLPLALRCPFNEWIWYLKGTLIFADFDHKAFFRRKILFVFAKKSNTLFTLDVSLNNKNIVLNGVFQPRSQGRLSVFDMRKKRRLNKSRKNGKYLQTG